MKSTVSILFILCFSGLFSQTETNTEYYIRKINQLKIETQMLEAIQKDYEKTIDSLYNLPTTDSLLKISTKQMVDYYILRTENMRNEMIAMVHLIDTLNALKKEEEIH